MHMKILFICGCLEPGRDGVGDYVQQLAGELIRQGSECCAVSINDKYVTALSESSIKSDNRKLKLFRIPSFLPDAEKFKLLQEQVIHFDAHWVSVQYVPYSFNNYGLPFFLSKALITVLIDRKVHFMFHETWVGASKPAKWKLLFTAFLQKRLIKEMVQSLKPLVVHVSFPENFNRLQKLRLPVKSLPLFSNIPVTSKLLNDEKGVIRVGIFSQFEINKPIMLFLEQLNKQVLDEGSSLEIFMMGVAQPLAAKFKIEMQEHTSLRNIKVVNAGYLDTVELSTALKNCTIGLTSVPRHALGKSGSVAAFLSHGIAVAAPCVHSGYSPDNVGFFSADLRSSIILNADFKEIERANLTVASARNEIMIKPVAAQFLFDLNFP